MLFGVTLHTDGFLSTPSARRATDGSSNAAPDRTISIHALREEGDGPPVPPIQKRPYFYPRPPRGGRPDYCCEEVKRIWISIHALREEGDRSRIPGKCCNQISIHALREEGDLPVFRGKIGIVISIHALREEGDIFQRR